MPRWPTMLQMCSDWLASMTSLALTACPGACRGFRGRGGLRWLTRRQKPEGLQKLQRSFSFLFPLWF
jgi:hypothetical protein